MSSYSQLHAGRSNLGASAATHSPTPTNAYAASTHGIIPLDDGSQDITLNFPEWKKSALRFFMGFGRGLDSNFGFASQILSLTEYQRLPGNVITTPGIVGTQKPTLRFQPIANGDTGGTLEKKKVNNRKVDEMQSELMHARNILIDSLGPVAAKTVELRDDSYGQITSTCRAIMRLMTEQYGTLASVEISTIVTRLSVPLQFATPIALRAHCASFRANNTLLENSDNELPEFMLVSIFNKTLESFPQLMQLISRFEIQCAEADPQREVTQYGIEDYLLRIIKRLTPAQIMGTTEEETTGPYPAFAAAKTAHPDDTMESAFSAMPKNAQAGFRDSMKAAIEEGIAQGIAAATATSSYKANDTKRGGKPTTGSGGRGAARSDRQPTLDYRRTTDASRIHYCWYHGYGQSHTGKDCHRMANDAAFTKAMKSAKNHNNVNGHSGSMLHMPSK